MPKRKRPEEKPDEQFNRFVEAAREHGVDESGEEPKRAFKSLATRKARAGTIARDGRAKRVRQDAS